MNNSKSKIKHHSLEDINTLITETLEACKAVLLEHLHYVMLWKALKDQVRKGELTDVETLSSRVIKGGEDVPVGHIRKIHPVLDQCSF
ncbi:uncharacterized protein BX663DRAFT_556572 [Cokeromyces recurvatus]|uniref:uncharacterized protein n=1 Tax=Cokeromyces recurvatus TaxID=90255 RepID=UPI00221F3D63|nr:uncharacterized protein BX663DRAFT_556572 [Cokeromyces recurvatus]KAI7897621.1 hypothetical protein BX663DRAFT_556572 [Cokeromyces recurvatus]